MRLAKFTDVALRVLMCLAAAKQELLTTRQVAEVVDVPYTHTAKAVARLQHLGLVEARRGRGGGLTLTTTGAGASIGGLVRELEGAGDVVGCEGDEPCPLASGCRLRGALRRAQEAFYASLDPITLTELIESPTGPMLIGMVGRAPARVV
ncbi:Rrf2 family transcriptional regulator [Streptomyces sp. SID3343]|uniref:RrF2 family transcriptional regulator n=1 Tax=Streptomyces sp. SID3343 TaxID=2690260 RepID=UPI001369ACE2|nr:Rrf2 family transcriptional regulator [Streptomyces sp. SID3343]MYV99733.1 Rrf2 family transcriptional regulator [Streptomyces sp. SID3343]